MNKKRYRLSFVLFGALVLVLGSYAAVEWFTRDKPNYARIEEGLWLGGFVPEPPKGTQVVANYCESEDPYQAEVHRWEPIRDASPAPSLDWLRSQVEFIQTQRNSGRIVYVHCRNGVSRSGMVVVAYIMARDRLTRDQAIEFVRAKRPELRPNRAFMELLIEWEQALKGEAR